ncbi:DNA (cytosine-5-)-methyltransferase [Paracoccus phage vB_PmaP_KLEP18-1]|nr:DNA (cytosine-5-)-methyltransferase [Paracoccus phage vB_PmaP_KLEP18-1]
MIAEPMIRRPVAWAYYNEFNPGAAAWLRELIKKGHIADGEVDTRSILDVRHTELRGFAQCHFFAGIGGWSYALRLAGWSDDRPVWTGSPPCQPFSAAGKGASRDDARHLAPHFISLVGAARPAVLFGEQVASAEVFGKAASGARKRAGGAPAWAWLDDLCDRLEAARYAVGASDFPSAGVGAKHRRQRTYFGAVAFPVRNEQPREEPCGRTSGRVGRIIKPFPWDEPWRCALSRLRAMDDGLPRSLVGTDAARNAIVPHAAAVFIQAFSEVIA